MRVLLDENLPHDMRHLITGHEVFTATYMGWSGVHNGELLRRAAAAGFDALVTKDAAMESQQSTRTLPVAVIILEARTNDIEDIRPLLSNLLATLDRLTPNAFVRVRA